MGLFGNNKKKNNEFHKYADKLIGNDSNNSAGSIPAEHIAPEQQEEILQKLADKKGTPYTEHNEEAMNNSANNYQDENTSSQLTDTQALAPEQDTPSAEPVTSANSDFSNDTTNDESTNNENYEQPVSPSYEDNTDQSSQEDVLTHESSEYTTNNQEENTVNKYELTPDKLVVVDKVVEDNYVFDVDAAFVDWFTNDLPVTAGENGLDSLRNRKVIAMHSLTKTYLKILLALDGNKEQSPKKFEDLTSEDIDKMKLSKGGFLTIYSDYIFNNIDYLLTAIRFYNGNINQVEDSNWHEINTSAYLQKLYSIAIHGSEYVHAHNNDYENAIVRMSKGVKNGNIRLDRD